MKINRSCATCEFNCRGYCGGGGGKYKYGEKITDKKYVCGVYGRSFTYHLKILDAAAPEIRALYDQNKISWEQLAEMI